MVAKGGPHVLATVPSVLRSQGLKRQELDIVGCGMNCAMSAGRQPWITTDGGTDPMPPGHTLVVTWTRMPEHADRNG